MKACCKPPSGSAVTTAAVRIAPGFHLATRMKSYLRVRLGGSLCWQSTELCKIDNAGSQGVHDHEAARALDGWGAREVLASPQTIRAGLEEDRRWA